MYVQRQAIDCSKISQKKLTRPGRRCMKGENLSDRFELMGNHTAQGTKTQAKSGI